jgi:hypothetical protein
MKTKDYETIGDPNDSRSATQDPQPPSGDCKAADPDTNSDANSCPPPDAKAILVTVPAQQREELSAALDREIEEERRRFQVAMAGAWHLLYESAYELARLGRTMAEGDSRTGVFSVSRKVKAESDRIYWMAKSIGFVTLSWDDVWLDAIVTLGELEDRLPPDSRTELIEMLRATHEDYYVRHYWQRLAEEATGQSIFAFCGDGAMSPTTFREWLKGNDTGPHNWRRFKDKLLKKLPDDKKYLADQIPGTLL